MTAAELQRIDEFVQDYVPGRYDADRDDQNADLRDHAVALISALRESQAKVERLTVALERVAEFHRRYTESLSTGTRYYHESECEIARAALKENCE